MHPLIRDMAGEDRAHDPWGTGMLVLGSLCDVLTIIGARDLVPAEAGYTPAMGLSWASVEDDDYGINTLLAGLYPDDYPGYWVEGYSPNLDTDDLAHAARVLNRYLDIVKLAGRDY